MDRDILAGIPDIRLECATAGDSPFCGVAVSTETLAEWAGVRTGSRGLAGATSMFLADVEDVERIVREEEAGERPMDWLGALSSSLGSGACVAAGVVTAASVTVAGTCIWSGSSVLCTLLASCFSPGPGRGNVSCSLPRGTGLGRTLALEAPRTAAFD